MHKNKIIYVVPLWAMSIIGLNGFTQVQDSLIFSLQQARTYAVEHSYNTRKSVMDQQVANKRAKEILATGLPQISAEADLNNNVIIPTTLSPNIFGTGDPNELIKLRFGTNYNLNSNVTVSQKVFDGSYIIGLKAARVYDDLSKKQVVKSKQEIQDDVTRAYGDVIVSQENFETLKWNKVFLAQTLSETREMYEGGFQVFKM